MAPRCGRSASPSVTDKAKPPQGPRRRSRAGGAGLSGAIAALLQPIAELAVARGLPFAAVEELFKAAFVEAARRAQPESAGGRIVSRVATATGLTRREVTRLVEADDSAGGPPPVRPSPATQVFTRWRADPALRDRRGRPRALPRQGPAPSFEALARSVTQDVHPRSLLDELCRLGLAEVVDDEVRLLRESVVAGRDSERAYRLSRQQRRRSPARQRRQRSRRDAAAPRAGGVRRRALGRIDGRLPRDRQGAVAGAARRRGAEAAGTWSTATRRPDDSATGGSGSASTPITTP